MSFLRSFQARVPGKWVLAGEHAVLRGGVAVALPHPDSGLELHFQPQVWAGLSILPARLEPFVLGLLKRLEDRVIRNGGRWTSPRGSLVIESSIPFGAGLGSSAALCVALTRWVQEEARLADSELFTFARSLEDEFHGQSSGMDVAVALAEQPIRFTREGGAQPLALGRLPRFSLHDTGLRASTKDCIRKVEKLREADPRQAERWDLEMKAASIEAIEALTRFASSTDTRSDSVSLQSLAQAMQKAQTAFEGWGLVPASVPAQIAALRAEGALAVKLTGAGGGGFLVALWA